MKLALVAVVCIGLYLCTVSAVGPGTSNAVDNLEFERIRAFVNGCQKCKNFPKNKEGYNNLREIHQKHEDGDFGSESIQEFGTGTINLYNKYRKYETFLKAVNDEYTSFLESVNEEYRRILKSSEDPKSTVTKYNLQSFGELMKADLDFKLKCILAFRTASKSTSSTRKIQKKAYGILGKQLGLFIKDLVDSGIDNGAKDKLKKISKKKDFLKLFGLWFASDWNENDLNNEIENTKREHQWGVNKDKAAKVMVTLKKLDGGKDDPPTQN